MKPSLTLACVLLFASPSIGSAQAIGPTTVYRQAVDAFTAGDADAYFGAFTSELQCFYGRRGVPLARVRAERAAALAANRRRADAHRLTIDELEVVQRADDAMVLRDFGHHGDRPHTKLVLLLRAEGRWRIAGEGGYGSACYVELLRPQAVTGVDPLATEEGIWQALRAIHDDPFDSFGSVLDVDRGALRVSGSSPSLTDTECGVPTYGGISPSEPRGSFECDEALSRCRMRDRVYRFAVRDRRRQLVAEVRYPGGAPAREPASVEAVVSERDRICELHDRLFWADAGLVTDDLWVIVADITDEVSARHLCGAPARRRSRRALGLMSGPGVRCTETRCGIDSDANNDAHVFARRDERGRLRLAIDVTTWASGTAIPRRFWRRAETVRCPSSP